MARLNGCHNKPESKPTYTVQTGWVYDLGTRHPVLREYPDRGSPGCGHPTKGQDPGCAGCRWQS